MNSTQIIITGIWFLIMVAGFVLVGNLAYRHHKVMKFLKENPEEPVTVMFGKRSNGIEVRYKNEFIEYLMEYDMKKHRRVHISKDETDRIIRNIVSYGDVVRYDRIQKECMEKDIRTKTPSTNITER
jgi:hypothetical protein